jgi:serine/threonine protein phosphatase PrpC
MGTYLSSPIVEKGCESGDDLEDPISPLAWGVVDMQGWRKSMEDSHVADTNVEIPPHLRTDDSWHDDSKGKVFGVFDGHGGPEVARFCQLYLVDVITKQSTWKEESPTDEGDSKDPAATPVGQALILAFHALDRMIDSRPRR